MQRSGATPLGAKTTTTPTGKTVEKKDIDAIAAAHHLAYMATACSAYPQDIYKKVAKALTFRGPTFIHILAPCPPGWRYPTEKTIEMGKLAVKSGMWVLYERENGQTHDQRPVKSRDEKTDPARRLPQTAGPVQGHRCKIP